jgi:hypothetical protein
MRPAPWHRPRWKTVAPGVQVYTEYGSHYIAAALHTVFLKVFRRGCDAV